jgi:ClpP class serine protease
LAAAQAKRQAAKQNDEIDLFNAVLLHARTKAPVGVVESWIQKDFKTWNAEQALADGLVDEIIDFGSTAEKASA